VGFGGAVGERELLDPAVRRDPSDLACCDLDEPQGVAVTGDAHRCGAGGGQRVEGDVAADGDAADRVRLVEGEPQGSVRACGDHRGEGTLNGQGELRDLTLETTPSGSGGSASVAG
jgi:hypothetical protein